MAYTRGTSSNIIVGAAALFTYEGGEMTDLNLPAPTLNTSFKESLDAASTTFRNVGYTSDGLELSFEPDFGEVKVDQVLDVAKLYKQGMKVTLKTKFAEATLENLLLALARPKTDAFIGTATSPSISYITTYGQQEDVLNLSAGDLGDIPVERGLVAVGPGSGDAANPAERIYVAYRALSIDNVSVAAKRDEATMFAVSFRMLPNNSGSYGKIVDRTFGASNKPGFPNN
jgi:hypothetical protein